MTITGVRWAESSNRKLNQGAVTVMSPGKKFTNQLLETEGFAPNKNGGVILVNDNTESRRMIEQCYQRKKVTVNPIIEWTDQNVWEFIKENNIPYCSLYDEGWERLGCIGCPLARTKAREAEFKRWPKYKTAYMRAFDKMLQMRADRGKMNGQWSMGTTSTDVFNWWMGYDILPGQIDLFEEEEDG